jgi:hypothetical protein
MHEIATGSLVKHRSLGVGKVVAVEAGALHVFFPESASRFAAKLRWPTVSPMLTREGFEPNAWLEGLTSFSMDPTAGRYALAANFISQDEALANFLESYPEGFRDPAYLGSGGAKKERASRWRAASAEWTEVFGDGKGERHLAEGEFKELTRKALRVAAHVTKIAGVIEQEVLAEALEPGDVATDFFEALFGYLSVPSPARARFEKLCAASNGLGAPPDVSWQLATLFPFLAVPTRQIILVPRSTTGAASRLGCDLQYQPAPNWATYVRLREFSARLLEKLQGSGATDFIDVESFLQATAARRPAAASHRTKAAAPATPAAKTKAKARRAAPPKAASRRKA